MKPVETKLKYYRWFLTAPSQAVIWRANGFKGVESNDFDADWGELDFMLVDLPQEPEIFIFQLCRLCQ
jgi:ATP-binding protein involved in chromosome partitioning